MDLRISELPVLQPADLEGGDEVAVADHSASETRRLTAKNLFEQGVARLIDDGSIPGAKLVPQSVTTLEIGPNAVGASELADNSVDTGALQVGSVSGGAGAKATIIAQSITTVDLATNAVDARVLADNAVDTAAVQAAAITNVKLAAGIDGAKLIADSVTAAQIGPDAVTSSELANNAVDTAAIQTAAVTNIKLAAGIDGAKLIADSVTATQIGPDAITDSELADNAVDTAAVQDAAITDAKLAAGIDGAKLTDGTVADAKIIDLDGGKIQAGTVTDAKLAAGIDGAKLTDGTVADAKIVGLNGSKIQAGTVDTAQVKDAAITDVKLATGIDGGKITTGTISATQIGTDAVGATQLANNAVDTASVRDAAITNAKLAAGIDGSKVTTGSLPVSALGAVTDRGLDQSTGKVGITNTVTPGTRNGITYDAQGLITGTAPLANTDLPLATDALVGGVIVPADSGLTVSGTGALDHANNITAGIRNGITYDEHGHIQSVVALNASDLPIATSVAIGAVSVPSGTGIEVDGAGALTHQPSGVVAGTHTKVTVNTQGHVTGGSPLAAGDIPSLDASKLNTGTLDPARIADRSVTNAKMANYSTVLIQETDPPGTDFYTGQLWYKESDAQLRTWSGNSWVSVGFGRLSQENLRFCGTFNAATGAIDQITAFGASAGMVAGQPVPTATDPLTGAYLVATTPGTFGGVVYDNGDWTLCLGGTPGWERVDTLNGAGTTTIKLADLLDTTITTPATGDTLIFDGTLGKWVNKPTAAQKATFVEAIDGVRTSFTLSKDATSVNNLLISIGGIIQEPGTDFTFVAPRTVNFAGPPPAGIDYWVMIEGVASTGGGGGGGTTLPDGTAAEEYLQWSATLGSWQPSTTLTGGTF